MRLHLTQSEPVTVGEIGDWLMVEQDKRKFVWRDGHAYEIQKDGWIPLFIPAWMLCQGYGFIENTYCSECNRQSKIRYCWMCSRREIMPPTPFSPYRNVKLFEEPICWGCWFIDEAAQSAVCTVLDLKHKLRHNASKGE